MPTYDYQCADHGSFSAFKPIAQYKDPEPCPDCAAPAPRIILRAPAVGGGSSSEAGGEAKPAWMSSMRSHKAGCACC